MPKYQPTTLPTGAQRVNSQHIGSWIVDADGNIIGQTGSTGRDTFFYSSTASGAGALGSSGALSSMANQGSTSVTITGGAINGTTVGTTTSAAGVFTTLSTVGARITGASARAVNTTAALASVTIAANIVTTYIATPAAAITITLAAAAGDGERRRIVFGAATTVTWAVTAPATATTGLKTTFAAGESIEVVYNSVAGTPANSAATTWYPF